MPSLNNETRFLIELSKTTKAYRWEVRNKQIVGVARNGKRRGLTQSLHFADLVEGETSRTHRQAEDRLREDLVSLNTCSCT